MKFAILPVLMVTLFAAVPAFALPGLPSLKAKMLDSLPTPTDDNCASFEGTWVGSCPTGNGAPQQITLAIHQHGCEAIEMGGTFAIIGGLKTESDSGQISADGTTLSVGGTSTIDWNADKSALNMTESAILRVGSKAPAQMSDTGTMTLNGPNLVIDRVFGTSHYTCSFIQQN